MASGAPTRASHTRIAGASGENGKRAMPTPDANPASDPVRHDASARVTQAPPSRVDGGDGQSSHLVRTLSRIASHSPPHGRYTLREELAAGGMGRVFRVRDEDLERDLAMKVVSLEPRAGSSDEERASHARLLERFVEEARITGQLDHPGIVPVHEIATDEEGRVYFTMPLLRGRTLKSASELARRGKEGWSLHRILSVVHRVCQTVAFAHERGIVHRDLKPENIMVGPLGEAYVIDWGLALRTGADEQDVVVGTPAYMAPEQAHPRSGAVGPRSDVYSLGAILYEVLTGRMPHATSLEQRPAEEAGSPLPTEPPRPVHAVAADVPDELAAICDKAMAPDPSDRYASAEALADELDAWLEGRVVRAYKSGPWTRLDKWRRRNRSLAFALETIVALVVAGALAFVFQQRVHLRRVNAEHRDAVRSSYAANIAAAELGLRMHVADEVQRRLQACPPALRGWEWHHLALRADSSERAWSGHADAVREVATSPDGQRFASSSDDGFVKVWNARSGELEASIDCRGVAVWSVAFDPRGARLATGDSDGNVRIWNLSTHVLARNSSFHEKGVKSLAYSPDGRFLASGGWDGRILVSRTDGDDPPLVLDSPEGSVLCLRYLDAERIVAGYNTGTVGFWDLSSALCTRLNRALESPTLALACSPDGRRVAVAGERDVVVFDAETLVPEITIAASERRVSDVRFGPDGTTLLTASSDGFLRTWGRGRGRPARRARRT